MALRLAWLVFINGLVRVAFSQEAVPGRVSAIQHPAATARTVQVFAPTGGRVTKLLVNLSSRVKRGQLLAVVQGPLSASDLAKARAMSKGAMDRAKGTTAALNAKVADLEAKRAKAIADQAAAAKNLKLIQNKPGHSGTDVAAAKASVQVASQRTAAIDSQIENAHQAFLADNTAAAAFAAFNRAHKFRDRARAKATKKIVATASGVVTAIFFKPGDVVRSKQKGPSVILMTIRS